MVNRKNNLNFGDWINNGVNFTDGEGEAWARKHCNLDAKVENASQEEKTPKRYVSLSKQSDIDFMDTVFATLATFLETPTEMIYEFQPCNSFLRRYIYEQVNQYVYIMYVCPICGLCSVFKNQTTSVCCSTQLYHTL